MKIIFNSREQAAFSQKKRETFISLMQSDGIDSIQFSLENNSGYAFNSAMSKNTVPNKLLLENLTGLQLDSLLLEKEIVDLKERNNYLEEKVNWLRNKAGEGSFIPLNVKPDLGIPLSNLDLNAALVKVINAMESKASGKAGLSFSKSKRARKDKALISESEYFDKEHVASQLKQLGLQVRDPLEFFVSYGAALELSPSEKFDTKSYLAMNPDVKSSGINPLLHYIKHGKAEGRVLI